MTRDTWTSTDALLLAALVALALNLRAPFTSVAPIVAEIQADLGINRTVAGLLTSIPVLCFGLVAPFASRCIARTSVETAVLLTLIGAIAGILIRSSGGLFLALTGTLVIGASLTIGNIVALVIIARDFPARASAVMGIYTSALNVGPMLTAGLSEPISRVIGWRWALVIWSGFGIIALGLWWRVIGRLRGAASGPTAQLLSAEDPTSADVVHVLQRPIVWLLIAAFAAHLLIYYGLSAWLPEYLQQAGGLSPTIAGLAAAFFQFFALAGTLGIPALSTRGGVRQVTLLLVISIAWIVTTTGLLLFPRLWPTWCIFGGFASGGGVTVVFMLAMAAANGLDDSRRISAAVQGMGYLFAASGPVVMGALVESTGSWVAGFSLLTGCGLALGGVALTLKRQRLRA